MVSQSGRRSDRWCEPSAHPCAVGGGEVPSKSRFLCEPEYVAVSQVVEGVVILVVAGGLGYLRSRRRQQRRVWTAWPREDDAPCAVALFGGARGGTQVHVMGLPRPGAELDDGVIARVYKGCYYVDSVSEPDRTAIATWKPRE